MTDLKYYLRGLGIGVVVTALIMGITANRNRETLSNEEIKRRARALGMVEESQVLADMLGEGDDAFSGEENTPEPASDAMSASVDDASLADDAAGTSAGFPDMPEASGGESGLPEDSNEPADGTESAEDESGDGSGEDSAANSEEETESGNEADSQEESESRDDGPEASEGGENASSGESVTIVVESGDGSFKICQKLEDAGIVPLASAFDRFLYENGYDKRINTGTYEIPAGADFEQIARIIARLD